MADFLMLLTPAEAFMIVLVCSLPFAAFTKPRVREPVLTEEEYAATRPPAPCGKQTEHYYWTELGGGMSCPACHADRKRRQKDAELDALADKIVARLRQAPAKQSAPSCAYPFCEPPECCGKPPTSGGTET